MRLSLLKNHCELYLEQKESIQSAMSSLELWEKNGTYMLYG